MRNLVLEGRAGFGSSGILDIYYNEVVNTY